MEKNPFTAHEKRDLPDESYADHLIDLTKLKTLGDVLTAESEGE